MPQIKLYGGVKTNEDRGVPEWLAERSRGNRRLVVRWGAGVAVSPFQMVAQKAKRLQDLGLRLAVIGRRIGVTDKTVAKAI